VNGEDFEEEKELVEGRELEFRNNKNSIFSLY
jgi:hypothetical protein